MKNLKESSNINSEYDIDEQVKGTNILSLIGDAKNFKGLSKSLQAAFKDMEIAIGLQKNPIMLGSKKLGTADDIFAALKDGSLVKNGKELGRVEKGLLKSANTDSALRKAIAVDYASDPTILAQFVKENKTNTKEIKDLLKSKGYPDSSINEIIAQMKKNGNIDSKGLFSVKSSGKVTPPKTPVEAPPVPKSLLSRTKELLDNIKIKKMSWKQLLAWGAGIGVGSVALWLYIKANSDVIPEGMPEKQPIEGGGEWLPCVQQMIKSKEGRLVTLADGKIAVVTKPVDYPGGLVYFTNGRVFNSATKDMGSYTCKEGVATINEVVGRILRERLLKEQSDNEVDNDAEEMVDLLDFPVTGNDLQNALKKLQKYSTSPKGKDFLQAYKDTGLGTGDLKKTLSFVVTTQASSARAKRTMLSLISQIESGTTPVTTPDNTKTGGGTGTTIVWDKDKKSDGSGKVDNGGKVDGGSGKKKSAFHDCEGKEFPLEYGCKSSKIAEVQKCLGVTDDGKFGRNTMKALVDNKYDTSRGLSKDVYDAVKTNCVPVENRRKLDTTPIELAKSVGLKMSGLAPGSIKMPDLSKIIQMKRQPIDLYNALKDAGYLKGDANETTLEDGTVLPATNRVKYKGDELDNETLTKLDNILANKGYERIKQKSKNYGEKYVWLQK